jgi:hypothetical protein
MKSNVMYLYLGALALLITVGGSDSPPLTFHDARYENMGVDACAGGFRQANWTGAYHRARSEMELENLPKTPRGEGRYSDSHTHGALLCRDENVAAMRLGPFEIAPGEWLDVADVQVEEAMGWLRVGDRLVSYVSHGVITRDGKGFSGFAASLNYPPLYLHHVHVSNRHTFHWWETHGDFMRLDPEEGKYTYVREVPPGYCMIVDRTAMDPLTVSALLVDKRLTGPPITFWLEVAFGLGTPTCKPLSLVWFKTPLSRVLPLKPWQRPPPCPVAEGAICREAQNAAMLYDRFLVAPAPSVAWYSVRMPISSRLLPGTWMHSHRARFLGLLVLRGRAAQSSPACKVLAGPWANYFEGHRAEDDEALERARDAFEFSHSDVLCRTDSRVADVVHWANASHFERAGHLECKSNMIFAEGEELTIVIFTKPRWEPAVEIYPMHVDTFFFVERDAGRDLADRGSPVQMEVRGEQWGLCATDSTNVSARL